MLIKECVKRLKDRDLCRLIFKVAQRGVLKYEYRNIKMAAVLNGPVAAVYTGYHVRTGRKHAVFMLVGALLVVETGGETRAVALNKEHAAMLNPHGKALGDLLALAAEIAGDLFG